MSKERLKEVKQLAFDVSFTSQDFKNMDLTKIDGGGKKADEEPPPPGKDETPLIERRIAVPKLRFGKIRKLKLCLTSFASREGSFSDETIRALFKSDLFADCVFDLMDINGDQLLDTNEIKLIAGLERDEGDVDDDPLMDFKVGL